MAAVAVIGEEPLVRGYALAGAIVLPAEGRDAVRAAWSALPADVGLVLLTVAAARALDPVDGHDGPLTAVMTR